MKLNDLEMNLLMSFKLDFEVRRLVDISGGRVAILYGNSSNLEVYDGSLGRRAGFISTKE